MIDNTTTRDATGDNYESRPFHIDKRRTTSSSIGGDPTTLHKLCIMRMGRGGRRLTANCTAGVIFVVMMYMTFLAGGGGGGIHPQQQYQHQHQHQHQHRQHPQYSSDKNIHRKMKDVIKKDDVNASLVPQYSSDENIHRKMKDIIKKDDVNTSLVVRVDEDDDEDENIMPRIRMMTRMRMRVTKNDGMMYETIGSPIYHNRDHFTQGLTYSRTTNSLFESNGLYGKSSVCKLDPSTGETQTCVTMDDTYFGEGLQVFRSPSPSGQEVEMGVAAAAAAAAAAATPPPPSPEKLIQITWKERIGFIYDADTLEVLGNFTFSSTRNEGWGICVDEQNQEFIMSDGSGNLHFIDIDTLREKRRVSVTRQTGLEAQNINELEFYNGMVLANVWHEDVILVIDPESGNCESEYDLSMLWPATDRRKKGAGVLNGISVSKDEGILYITGKNWDRMFKLKLKHL